VPFVVVKLKGVKHLILVPGKVFSMTEPGLQLNIAANRSLSISLILAKNKTPVFRGFARTFCSVVMSGFSG